MESAEPQTLPHAAQVLTSTDDQELYYRAVDKGAIEKPQFPLNRLGLKQALKFHGIAIRYNVRDLLEEWSFDGGETWEPTDDFRDNRTRCILEEMCHTVVPKGSDKEPGPYTWPDNKWRRCLSGLADETRVDPFAEWMYSLPRWDGTPGISYMLHVVFQNVENSQLACWTSRAMWLAPVARTLNPGCRQDTIVTLMSKKQGTGKSTYIRELAEPFAGTLFSDSLDLSLGMKEAFEAVGTSAIVEASEIQGWRTADINRLKAYISRRTDRLRPAYGRKTVAVPRRFALYATTNDARPIPNDPSGARRFLVVEVERGKVGPPEEFMKSACNAAGDSWVAQCYAESLEMVKGGETTDVPAGLKDAH